VPEAGVPLSTPAEFKVTPLGNEPLVTLKSRIGSTRIVDMLSGEQLPRIC
jgi:hydrogenase maturation factor